MATVNFFTIEAQVGPAPAPESPANRRVNGQRRTLHRINTVRRQQGMSLRTAARQLGSDIRRVRSQENESTDLRLSDLYDWQQALEVPVSELLVEPNDELSRPVQQRARMVRLMKTAAALLEQAKSPRMKRMSQMMVNQLVEIMPELEDVGPWHSIGQPRSTTEFGRVVERTLSEESLFDARR